MPARMARQASPIHVKALALLTDEPVPDHDTDELQLCPFASIVAGAAAGTEGPFTIGVFGDWGTGKTSILRQARSLIREAYPEVVTVWFNAWQHEKEEHPIVPLVAAIVHELESGGHGRGGGQERRTGAQKSPRCTSSEGAS